MLPLLQLRSVVTNKALSEEDILLFRSHMQGVQPLAQSARILTSKTPQETAKRPNPIEGNIAPKTPPVFTRPYLTQELYQTTDPEAYLSFCRPNFDKKYFKQLQQGKLPVLQSLDLHGMQRDEASEAVTNFIQDLVTSRRFVQPLRCARIVHGKGGKMGETPIMKSFINIWLPEFNDLMAFCSALPRDGGTGAVSILIKTKSFEWG